MVQLHRRTLAALAVATLAAPGIVSRAEARAPSRAVTEAIAGFAKLPGASCLVIAETKDPWKADHEPGERRFVGSAVKTFILARYLRDVEEGQRTLAEQLAVNDTAQDAEQPGVPQSQRHDGGDQRARSHDHPQRQYRDRHRDGGGRRRPRARADRRSRPRNTKIADSMRKMFCYLAGLPAGQDAGWPKVKDLVEHPPNPRPALNDVMTMASTADDMVSLVLAGAAQRLLQDARHAGGIQAHPGDGHGAAAGRADPASWPTARAAASTGRTSTACRCRARWWSARRRHVLLHDQLDRAGQRRARHDEAYVAAVAGVLEASAKARSDRDGHQAVDGAGRVDPARRTGTIRRRFRRLDRSAKREHRSSDGEN